MSRLLPLLLLTGVLWSADSRIDHVTIAGTSVKELQAKLAAIGLNAVYGGAHTNKTTEMALISFPDGSYLELMGLQAGAESKIVDQHVWGKFLKANGGPCAWALREKNIAAEVKRLRDAGVTVSEPAASGRSRPDGVRLAWETSQIGTSPMGTFFPFLIQDHSPRAQRVYPQGKPVTRDFPGVARVVIAVRDLDDAIDRYRKAFGVPRPIRQVDRAFGAQMALLGDIPVILAQPAGADSWLYERLEKFGEGPCAFVLGERRSGRYATATETRWFGTKILWFDAEKLGWRLGIEAQ